MRTSRHSGRFESGLKENQTLQADTAIKPLGIMGHAGNRCPIDRNTMQAQQLLESQMVV
jgi:hypothetical protein